MSAGLTQEVLAARAGISTSYLSNIEQGHKVPSADVVIRLAVCLDLPPRQFIECASADSVRDYDNALKNYELRAAS